jgi:drug/metabolite transporter (DMT)-like permease
MVATRFVVDQTGPASLALLRYAIGVCCLLPVVLLSGGIRFARRDVLPIALLGITQFGILIALLNYGLRFITAGRAALIFATLPLLAMALSVALGRERLTLAKTAGVLLTIVGVGLTVGSGDWGVWGRWGGWGAISGSSQFQAALAPGLGGWIGELAVLASALSGAVCSVLYRPYLRRYPTLAVSAFAMLASVAFLALLAAAEGFFAGVPRFTGAAWLAIAFIGVNSAIGYYLWLWALNHAPATQVTVFLSLSPVTAAALGALLLGEPVTAGAIVALVCVALGLKLAVE